MTILLTDDAAAFADRAGDFLQTRVECNLLATVLAAVRAGTFAGRGELFACVLDGSGQVCGAALRTPPWPMLCSPLERDAAGELIGAFTDLANPTSNEIYAEVGYRRLCDWETIALEPAGEGR